MLWRATDGGDSYLAYYIDLTATSPRGVTRLQDCRLQAAEDGGIALYVRSDGRRLMLLDAGEPHCRAAWLAALSEGAEGAEGAEGGVETLKTSWEAFEWFDEERQFLAANGGASPLPTTPQQRFTGAPQRPPSWSKMVTAQAAEKAAAEKAAAEKAAAEKAAAAEAAVVSAAGADGGSAAGAGAGSGSGSGSGPGSGSGSGSGESIALGGSELAQLWCEEELVRSLAELEASRALRAFLALEWHELERLLLAPMATHTATGGEAAAGGGAAADGGTAASDGMAAEEEEAAAEEAAAAAVADGSSLPLRLLQTLLQHVMSCPLLRSVARDELP